MMDQLKQQFQTLMEKQAAAKKEEDE